MQTLPEIDPFKQAFFILFKFIALRVDSFFWYMPNYCDMHFPNYFPFHSKVANSLYCRLSVNTAGACDLTLGVKGGCRPLR